MRGRGSRGGSKFGERKSFSDRGGSRGGGFGSSRGSGPGDSRSKFSDSRPGSGGGFRGSDRSSGRRGGPPRDAGGYRGGGVGSNSLKGKQPGGNLRKPVWDMSQLQPFDKNFYKPHPRVQNR